METLFKKALPVLLTHRAAQVNPKKRRHFFLDPASPFSYIQFGKSEYLSNVLDVTMSS